MQALYVTLAWACCFWHERQRCSLSFDFFQIKNKRKQLFNLLLLDLFVYKQRFPIHKRMKKIRFDTLVLWCLSILNNGW